MRAARTDGGDRDLARRVQPGAALIGLGCAGLLALYAIHPALADDEAGPKDGVPEQSIANELPGKGDIGGHRNRLADQGITYGFNYIGEVQGNVSGGSQRRAIYVGRLEGFVDFDFEKLAGWKGFTVHANAYQIHGHGLSINDIHNLMPASFIEAHPTTRLFELWGEQKLFNELLAVRFGQLAADSEFFTSGYAVQFINGTFGWPAAYGTNLPSGGSAFPLATPGVRVQVNPVKGVSWLTGLFNGDPAGRCDASDDPQECNRYGVNFRTSDPAFVISELQYKYNQEKGASGLAGTVKVGGWHHFGKFDDQRFAVDGTVLAGGNPNALRHRGNDGIYGIIDQQIWRPSSGEPDKGVGVFARVSASPADRNLVDFYIDGGIVFAGMIPMRPDDIVSFGAAYARISGSARDADTDDITLNGVVKPVRDYEALFEFNYQAQVMSGWTVDADVQYIWHPGGNIADPSRTDGLPIKDAAVLTLHTAIKY